MLWKSRPPWVVGKILAECTDQPGVRNNGNVSDTHRGRTSLHPHFDTTSTVVVIGLGYIGLPTAAFLADAGVQVVGVDINQTTVDKVNSGIVPFVEKGFDELLKKVVSSGRLTATTEVPEGDAFIITVPTPFQEDHSVDDSYVMAAADNIIPVLRGGELVVLESTSPPGLTERMADRITAHAKSIEAAHCPERVLPGAIMKEIVQNDRIIGGLSDVATERASALYRLFTTGEHHLTDARTAETAKLTENAFRAVNIAFANELSMICEDLGIDVWELIGLANHHPRVNILQPGPGVGGHCIAVDPWFLISSAPDSARLMRTAREVNDSKPEFVLERIRERQADSLAIFGLAFKANIDDLRESPALKIAVQLATEFPGHRIQVVEPHITELPAVLANFRNVELVEVDEVTADLKVMLVGHDAFRDIEGEMLSFIS